MSFHPRKLLLISAMILMAALAGCSLAEDITPPPNYRPPTAVPEQPVAHETVYPLVPPDPAQGMAIYAEKCLPCHGETGMGDGPQAGNLPNPAAPIGNAELARASRPVDWYNIVTVGNLEKFMPGFSSGLTDRERWDVVAYSFSLSTSPAEMAQGKMLYDANCAECHGETGMGDGEQAASLSTAPASWVKDQSRLAALSAQDMAQIMAGGLDGHPSFANELDESERYQVAAYIRGLSFAGGTQPDPSAQVETPETASATAVAEATPDPDATAAPAEVAVAPQSITVRGRVSNATPGGAVPQGLKATLLAFSGMSQAFEQSAEVAADGAYVFEDVEYSADMIYMVQVDANGVIFNSDVLHGGDLSGEEAELPVSIYDTTTDASVLRSDRMHVFFDFSTPGKVQVANLYIISNSSDKVVVAEGEGSPVLTYELPEGATNLIFEDGAIGDRFVDTGNGFGDLMNVGPGEGATQILFAYDLPYERKLSVKIKPPLPVDAAVVMLPLGVKLASDQLMDAGQRDVQDGMSVQMYQTSGGLAAGQTLDLTLSGQASAGGAAGQDSLASLLIGLGALGLVLAGAGWWLYTRRREMEPALAGAAGEADEAAPFAEGEGQSSDALLDEIMALDDLHASGKLPEAAYQERRAALKARLAEILKDEKHQ